MPKSLKIRPANPEEMDAIRRLACSRKEPASLVQRARVIQLMLDNPHLSAAEAGHRAGFQTALSGRYWVKRFNKDGIEGLHDQPRPGRPLVHDQRVRRALIDLAQQQPQALGYPFEQWTLEHLQQAFEDLQGIRLSDSTIWEWLDAEG